MRKLAIILCLLALPCLAQNRIVPAMDMIRASSHAAAGAGGSSVVVTNGLIGYWTLDGHPNDWTNTANNGTVFGATLTNGVTEGRHAYYFTGGQYIDITNQAAFALTADITITAWIKPAAQATWGLIVGNATGGAGVGGYGILFNDAVANVPEFWARHAGARYDGSLDANWHFVAIRVASGIVGVYVDGGMESGTGGSPNLLETTPNDVHFGAAPVSGQYYQGAIEFVRIYNRAITTNEINSIYTAQQ